jgi:hypothetical protein
MGPCGHLVVVLMFWASISAVQPTVFAVGLLVAAAAGGYDGFQALRAPKVERPAGTMATAIGLLLISLGAFTVAMRILVMPLLWRPAEVMVPQTIQSSCVGRAIFGDSPGPPT